MVWVKISKIVKCLIVELGMRLKNEKWKFQLTLEFCSVKQVNDFLFHSSHGFCPSILPDLLPSQMLSLFKLRYLTSSFAPVILTRGHHLTVNINMTRNKLLAQVTFFHVFSTAVVWVMNNPPFYICKTKHFITFYVHGSWTIPSSFPSQYGCSDETTLTAVLLKSSNRCGVP